MREVTAVQKRVLNRRFEEAVLPQLLTFPTTLLLFIFVAVPSLVNIVLSLTNYSLVEPVKKFVGFSNYTYLIENDVIWNAFRITLIWTAANIFPIFLLGIGIALLMNTNLKGIGILKAIILLPWILPEFVTGYTWKWMLLSDFGILHNFLVDIGVIGKDFSFFSQPTGAMIGVVVANVWRSFPFISIMLYAKMKSLPTELTEAARIDGANSAQIFRHITVSWIMPVLGRLFALMAVWLFNAFSIIYVMTVGGPGKMTSTLPLLMQQYAFRHYKIGEAATIGCIIMVFMAIVILLVRGSVRQWKKARHGL